MEHSRNENVSAPNIPLSLDPTKMFRKRPGTANVGKDYENALMANIALQQIFDKTSEDFLIWSNDKNFGAFDDVILRSDTKCAIQLKHAANKSRAVILDAFKADKGDFSVKKYFESFKKYESSLSDYDLIIFTNKKFALGKNQELSLSDGEKFRVRIVEVDVNPLINTQKENQKCFKFEIIQETRSSKLKNYEQFFKKLFIYANQIDVAELEQNIYKQIEEKCLGKKDVSKDFLNFFAKWNLVEGPKNKLDKAMMKRLLALYLVSANFHPISFGPISKNRSIFQSAMSKFHVTTFDKECSQNIWVDCKSKLDVKDANIINKHYQITKFSLKDINNLDNEERTELLWFMDQCPLIVEESEEVHQAIRLCSDRRFVVLTNNNSLDLEEHSVFSKLSDLQVYPEIHNDILSHFKCLLSKKEISLKQIENEEIQDDITTNELLLMVDEPYKIKEDIEELPETYIERHLTRNIIDSTFLDNIDKDTLVFVSNVKRVEDLNRNNAVDVKTYLNDKSSKQINFKSEDQISRKPLPENKSNKLHLSKMFEKKLEGTKGVNSYQKQNSVEDCLSKEEEMFERNVKINTHMVVNHTTRKDKTTKQKFFFTSENQNSELLFQTICDGNLYQSYHHLKMVDGRLEWIKSVGSISSLKQYRFEDRSIKEEELANTNGKNTINIVVGDPGLGKSCFLKKLKNCFSSRTVVTIFTPHDMKEISDFTKKNTDKLEDFIMDLKYSNWKKLDRCVVKRLTEQNEVIYLWDALDEIVNDEDRNKILEIVRKFSEKGIMQWITCRRHLKDTLETQFDVLSQTLVEFDKIQQTIYIQERLESVCSDEVERNDLTNRILNNVGILKHRDILSIPLQIYMLTEICRRDKSRILDLVKGVFSLANLYEYFVEEKFNFYYKKDKSDVDKFKLEKNMFIRNFEKVALKTILEDAIFSKLNVDNDEILEDLKGLGDKFGFVTEVIESNSRSTIKFSHISYAEYFVASYFARRKIEIIKSFIFEKKYENVRFFLDLLLAKNCPAHISVLYNNLEELKCEKELECKDAWGRNLLHLACSWGGNWKRLHFEKNCDNLECEGYHFNVNETPLKYIQLIQVLISNKCDINETDSFMSKNALEFAEKSNSMFALATIEEKCQTGYLSSTDESIKCNILFYSVEFNLKQFIPLLKSYVNRIKLGSEKSTLLHLACKNGNDEMVKVLTDNGSNISASNLLNDTPFMIACQNGHVKTVEVLIKAGVDIDAFDKDGWTAFMSACFQGHKEIVATLMKAKVDINSSNRNGWTAFMFACFEGHEKIVEMLMKAGVDIDASEEEGSTAFMFACENGHDKIVRLLIETGVDVNCVSSHFSTAIYFASFKGHHETVQILINAGAAVDPTDADGTTPLIEACSYGYSETVALLVKFGANVNAVDKDGLSPVGAAFFNNHKKIVKLLIANGAELAPTVNAYSTPLYCWCENGNVEIVRSFIEMGANLETVVYNGWRAIHIACFQGHTGIVKLLLDSGANVNSLTSSGDSPIQLASENSHVSVVELIESYQSHQS